MKTAVIALVSLLLLGASRADEETTTLKDVATSSQVTTSDQMSTTPAKVNEEVSSSSQPSSTDAIATTLKVVVLNGPASTVPIKPFFLKDGPSDIVPGLVPKDLPATSEAPKEMPTTHEDVSTSTTITKIISEGVAKVNTEDKVIITPETTEIKTTLAPSTGTESTTGMPREQRQADSETTTSSKASETSSEESEHKHTTYTIPPFRGTTPNFTALRIEMARRTTIKPDSEQDLTTIIPEIRNLNTGKTDVVSTSEASKAPEASSETMVKTTEKSSDESSTEMSKDEKSTTASLLVKLIGSKMEPKDDSTTKPKEETTAASSTEVSSTSKSD